jgi:hypothetical protein
MAAPAEGQGVVERVELRFDSPNDDAESMENAPAAVYFVISVLPISVTSGAFPAVRAASSLPRCLPQGR